jgi:acyl carrier protein
MSLKRLTAVFRETFLRDDLALTPSTSALNVPEWDSFNHINLVIAVETEFDVRLTTEEISGMRNVGDLVVTLNQKGTSIDWDGPAG